MYCSKCQKIFEEKQEELQKERDRRYNKKLDPKYKQFYNSNEWKVLKEKKLQDDQDLCERCSELALEEHLSHKYIQIEEGGYYMTITKAINTKYADVIIERK